jgi:hypothetical protein
MTWARDVPLVRATRAIGLLRFIPGELAQLNPGGRSL